MDIAIYRCLITAIVVIGALLLLFVAAHFYDKMMPFFRYTKIGKATLAAILFAVTMLTVTLIRLHISVGD